MTPRDRKAIAVAAFKIMQACRSLGPIAKAEEAPYAPTTPRKTPIWFALAEDRPCSPSRDCGPVGGACAGRRVRRSRASMSYLGF